MLPEKWNLIMRIPVVSQQTKTLALQVRSMSNNRYTLKECIRAVRGLDCLGPGDSELSYLAYKAEKNTAAYKKWSAQMRIEGEERLARAIARKTAACKVVIQP